MFLFTFLGHHVYLPYKIEITDIAEVIQCVIFIIRRSIKICIFSFQVWSCFALLWLRLALIAFQMEVNINSMFNRSISHIYLHSNLVHFYNTDNFNQWFIHFKSHSRLGNTFWRILQTNQLNNLNRNTSILRLSILDIRKRLNNKSFLLKFSGICFIFMFTYNFSR